MSKFIPLADIVIKENRQRQSFDAQKEDDLRSSIETVGLLHAPVLRKDGNQMVLVAGETRLRAIKDIWALGGSFTYDGQPVKPDMVPFVTLGDLTPLEAEEAELDENLKRADLTWQERAEAETRLHKLRVKQAEKHQQDYMAAREEAIKKDLPPPALEAAPKPHTVTDTAMELHGRADGYFRDSVQKNIILTNHLNDPDVAKAKTAKEAFKIVVKKEEMAKNANLAAAVGKTFNSESHQLFNRSCLEVMLEPEMKGKFDVILTDPPYGMGADEFGDGGGKLSNSEHHYDDSYESWVKLMNAWAPLTMLVTKPEAHLYAFCDFDRFHELKNILETYGWDVFRTPFIIRKLNSGRVPRPEHGPRRQYELCLYAIKGNKTVNMILPDVIEAQADQNMTHGAQKPIAIYQQLLARSIRPGDHVLDCFAGSGTILPAAHLSKVKATAIEMMPEYYGMCLKRIDQIKAMESDPLNNLIG